MVATNPHPYIAYGCNNAFILAEGVNSFTRVDGLKVRICISRTLARNFSRYGSNAFLGVGAFGGVAGIVLAGIIQMAYLDWVDRVNPQGFCVEGYFIPLAPYFYVTRHWLQR